MNTTTAGDTEQQLLLDAVRRFAKEQILPKATEIDRTDQFPRSLYQAMGEMGLFGIALPESAGGSGMSIGTACLAME